jgi:hydroxypyruvate isomerase
VRVCANLSLLFTELPLPARVHVAAAAGFDGVEIQFPYELPALQLKSALLDSGMPLVLINLPAGDLMSGGAGLAAVQSRQRDFEAALQQALVYAAVVRPHYVNVLPGRAGEGEPHEVALATLAANLRKTAESFQELGVGVLCEAINPLDMPGFLINTAEDLDGLLRLVDHPNCKAQLDIYHMARQGLDVVRCIETLAGRIGHVQFADCPGRGAPGSGEVAFEPLLRRLSESGYQGWLGAEYRPTGPAAEGLAWLADWQRGSYCN